MGGSARELGSGELTRGVNVPADVLGTNTGAARLTDLVVVVDTFVLVEAFGGGILSVSLRQAGGLTIREEVLLLRYPLLAELLVPILSRLMGGHTAG